MPRVLEVYVDTSVWSYIHANHMPEGQKVTLNFFRAVSKKIVGIFISEVVIQEINSAPTTLYKKLVSSVKEYAPGDQGACAEKTARKEDSREQQGIDQAKDKFQWNRYGGSPPPDR